jgi:Family of unknown function (DUF6262)
MDTTPTDQARAQTLRRAAAAKHQAAISRAEAGIRRLTKAGQPVTFRGVASAGGVSVDFLYRHPELRMRIERLRNQQRKHSGQPTATDLTPRGEQHSNVVSTLTARLAETRRELTTVKEQLAIAQGELLALRRRAQSWPSVAAN